jgi:hypothetical protein
MADISSAIKEQRGMSSKRSNGYIYRTYKLDFLDTTDGDIGTLAKHDIVPIAIGEAFLGARFIVTTGFSNLATDLTVKFHVSGGGGNVLTGAIPQANLIAGDVLSLHTNDFSVDTTTVRGYSHTTAATVQVELAGTAALTAGVGVLICEFCDATALLNGGTVA